jgi:predicted DNA-binding protein (MmcQ/YjbR family)
MGRGLSIPANDPILKRLRSICLSLPDTTEVEAWGHPTFRVDGSIFVGFGTDAGGPCISFKATKGDQKRLTQSAPYYIAPYVGRFGWVGMHLTSGVDWDVVTGHILESYRLIAPKKVLAKMDGVEPTPRRPARKRVARPSSVRRRKS